MQSGDHSTSSTAPTTSSSPPQLSRSSSFTDITIEQPLPPHSSDVQSSIGIMQGSLDHLQDVLQRLEVETLSPALAGSSELSEELNRIREGIEAVQKAHDNGRHEIDLLMKDLLEKQAVEILQKEVDKEIESMMHKLVKEEVKNYLEAAIPSKLQQEVEKSKKELAAVSIDLHNSESKRMNALLREKNRHEPLHTILRPDGSPSEHFPKTLEELFNADTKTCQALVEDYEIKSVASKDGNLNRFMHFCGVQFQMVRRGDVTKLVAFIVDDV